MPRPDKLKLSRRSLLKSAGAVTAAAVTSSRSSEAEAFDLLPVPEAPVPDRVVPSFCEVCFWNCGLKAHVKGNRVLYVTGHPDHPSSRGKLCARGNAGADFITNPDRLRYPMVRVGKRGEGKFERVGWPVAYRTIAEGFQRIKAKHGSRALAVFYHGKSGPMVRNMMIAFGCPNYAAPAYAQCKGPRNVGYKLTFGVKLPSPEPLDLDRTDCMVLFGSHLGENAHNSQVQQFVAARRRGASLVVLDPRLSTVAARADLWLPVRPGSDTAVILAWLHLLIARDRYDRTFVEQHCTGFEQLAAHVKPFTPAWAAKQAGVPARDIERAYDMMVKAMPAVVVHPGRHVTWYGEADTQRARGQAILNALLGAWWREGGTFRPSRPTLADFPGPDYPELPDHVDKAAERFPFALEPTTNGIRDATRTGKPYPIKGWFVHGTNLIQSMPNVHHTEEALRALDFLAVCDVQPTEITRWADVLLPEDIYLERYDDLSAWPGKRPFIALRQPAVTSPYDTRPGWRIAKELGTALGVGDFFAFDTIEQFLEARLVGTGVTLAQLKRDGVAFPKVDVKPYLAPGEQVHWHTPSGKVELYSERLKAAGFDPLPVHRPLPEPPRGMLRLLYGRSPMHTFGRTQNLQILGDLDPGNCLWLNPCCAKALGIKHRTPVMLENPHGDLTGPLVARISERVQKKTVYTVHGFGHRAPGLRQTCCTGGSDTDVIDDYAVDPISGGTGMRVQFVRVRPLDDAEREMYPCA